MNDLGYLKEIKTGSFIFILDAGEVEIDVDMMTKDAMEAIFQEDNEALVPLDVGRGKVIKKH